MTLTMVVLIGTFVFMSYFLGNLPFGYLIGRFFLGIDIQERGSKKGGTTNFIRTTKDTILGLIVGACDLGVKGTLWVCAVYYVFTVSFQIPWVVFLCFAVVLLGHIFPVLTKFKTAGGGIATLIGGALPLVPIFGYAMAAAAWLITFRFTKGLRFLCNIVAVAVLMMSGLVFNFSWFILGFALFAVALIVFAHRQNISQMKKGLPL